MSTVVREKFSSQASPEVLAALRKIAETEGRQFQAVLDEALREYIAGKESGRAAPPRDGRARPEHRRV